MRLFCYVPFLALQLVAQQRQGPECFNIPPLTFENCCLPQPMSECFDGQHFTAERCCRYDKLESSPPQDEEDGEYITEYGDPECWGYGVLTYEFCCLPQPQSVCFHNDLVFTAERCCGRKRKVRLSSIDRLRHEIFTGRDPYKLLETSCGQFRPEHHYPDSHLTPEIVRVVMGLLPSAPALWVEIGSMVGNSAITTAATIKAMQLPTGVVCIDPWTGVAEMWSGRKAFKERFSMYPHVENALKMDPYGTTRIYEQFLANVVGAGQHDLIMPLRVSSVTGLKLLRRLYYEKRIERLPEVIYLDSAHEEDETLLEVREAWKTLAAPGMLFGDDWSRPAVKADVEVFAKAMDFPAVSEEELRKYDTPTHIARQTVPGVVVISRDDGTWFIFKRHADYGQGIGKFQPRIGPPVQPDGLR